MKVFLQLAVAIVISCGLCYAGTPGISSGKSTPDNSYLFPTDASHRITSGFGDYRETHFHGGIDISTNGKIGYPVYAAKAGYVYRVQVSPFGYGKMIVLKQDDSTYTLYGHLSQFSKEIEEKVAAAQRSKGKYSVHLRFKPGEIPVRRGEIIARTGATGVGAPHLHFEIHDRSYAYIDPLTFRSINVAQYIRPRIFGVAVKELTSGKVETSRVSRSHGEYRTRREFKLSGPFYFIIHAADSYGHDRFKRPPKHVVLKIDGKDFLSLNLTRIPANDYLDITSLVDLQLSRGYKTYYKLCVDRAIPFPVFTPSSPLSGLIDRNFSNGVHRYEITVSDEDNNSATVTGRFVLQIPKSERLAESTGKDPSLTIEPFKEHTFKPSPSLTVEFPANCFTKDVEIAVRRVSDTSFEVEPMNKHTRKRFTVEWKVDDPKLRLFKKEGERWSYVPCTNNGKAVTAEVGYSTGEFAVLRDDVPPIIERIHVSRTNPFYTSVAPKVFNRVFVYFRVVDRLSGINTDNILLKVGKKNYLCEYDVDERAAVCKVDANLLHREKKLTVIVSDHAGNERTVVARPKF